MKPPNHSSTTVKLLKQITYKSIEKKKYILKRKKPVEPTTIQPVQSGSIRMHYY